MSFHQTKWGLPPKTQLDRALLAYDGSPKADEALYTAKKTGRDRVVPSAA